MIVAMHQVKADVPDFVQCRRIHARSVLEEVLMYARRLPLRERVMVTMRYRDKYTLDQMAAAFGINPRTVKRRLVKIAVKLCEMKKEAVAE